MTNPGSGAALWADGRTPAADLRALALVAATWVFELDASVVDHIYFHECVDHVPHLALLPCGPVWVSDEIGESQMAWVKAVLSDFRPEWQLFAHELRCTL